ncbi:hypothetical protein QMY54_05035 [Pseudomonas rhodesiae]|nr:hypothetical protein QMY54_05035 [Pseudomonas rhodesiae]
MFFPKTIIIYNNGIQKIIIPAFSIKETQNFIILSNTINGNSDLRARVFKLKNYKLKVIVSEKGLVFDTIFSFRRMLNRNFWFKIQTLTIKGNALDVFRFNSSVEFFNRHEIDSCANQHYC